jgi:hypothetical protein
MSFKNGRRPGDRLGRLALTALLVAAPLALSGCGKQGDPTPPLRAVPAPTRDLAVVQQGPRLLLSLSYPQTTPAGAALEGITTVEVLEVTREASSDGKAAPMDPRQFTSGAQVTQRLTGADLNSATEGSRINLQVPLPPAAAGTAPQARYFAVRTYGKNNDPSDLSNVVAVVPKAPPTSPSQITTTPRADGILIEWAGVEGATGYNVYRRGAQERAHGKPLHTATGAERSWLDATAAFGQSYIYAVTALSQTEPPIESAIASEREVRYQDRFAPPPPTELVALAESARVRLVWRASEAEDVVGYIVYRRTGGGDFERVTAQPLENAEYIDTAIASGQAYTYRVTAVDSAGNESGPGNEVRATVP